MSDVESFAKLFKFGDIEDIFVIIYSYFIIGYLILFITYEQNFTNLQLYSQIILSIAISLPIMGITSSLGTLVDTSFLKKEFTEPINKESHKEPINKEDTGFFSETTLISFIISIYYSSIFSLIYLFKHSKIIDYNFDPFTTVKVILFTLILLLLIIFSIEVMKYLDKMVG